MIRGNHVILSVFIASITILSGSAYAESQNDGTNDEANAAPTTTQPAPAPPTQRVRFTCEFFGTFAGKTPGSLGCKARGKMTFETLEDFFFRQGDGENVLEFSCRDRDHEPYYDGPISYGVAPQVVDAQGGNGDERHFNAVITGVRTTAPWIVIQDINLNNLAHEGSGDSSDGMKTLERPAWVSFNWYGIPTRISGVCVLRVIN